MKHLNLLLCALLIVCAAQAQITLEIENCPISVDGNTVELIKARANLTNNGVQPLIVGVRGGTRDKLSRGASNWCRYRYIGS